MDTKQKVIGANPAARLANQVIRRANFGLEQRQPDWNSLAGQVARENNGLERADRFQSA
jgi:hypothetical protein